MVECNALPALIWLLCYENVTIHYEAVSVIEHLIHLSPRNKKRLLRFVALQPVIRLLSSCCIKSEKGLPTSILGQFALTETDFEVHMVQRGGVGPLIEFVQWQDVELKVASFTLEILAQDNIVNFITTRGVQKLEGGEFLQVGG